MRHKEERDWVGDKGDEDRQVVTIPRCLAWKMKRVMIELVTWRDRGDKAIQGGKRGAQLGHVELRCVPHPGRSSRSRGPGCRGHLGPGGGDLEAISLRS